ncbi:MAG: sugar ABC transporter substrate-binding protein [Christensenellales bacterium]|jgi:ABC-type sugar transport system substrate-binding protein
MKKIVSIGLVVVMLLVMAAGCGSNPPTSQASPQASEAPSGDNSAPETSESPSTPERPVKIGVSMGTTTNLFYSKMSQIIQDYCAEIGVECVVTDENHDVSKQISSIENFISSGCTAIMLVAFDPQGVSDVVKTAVDQGIYVMAYDGIVDGAQGSMNLDNYVYGYQTGTMAADWVNANPELKEQEVIEAGIFDYPDIPAIIDRAKGIADALTEKAPNVKIVAQQKAGVGDEGNIQGENFLAAHPNIQIICGINDTGVLGAYEVFKTANHLGDNIGMFGADGDPQALELISQDTSYRGTVMSGAYAAFPSAIDILVAASNGEEVEGHMIYDTVPITIENVQEYLED